MPLLYKTFQAVLRTINQVRDGRFNRLIIKDQKRDIKRFWSFCF